MQIPEYIPDGRFREYLDFFKHFMIEPYDIKIIVDEQTYALFCSIMKEPALAGIEQNGIILNCHNISSFGSYVFDIRANGKKDINILIIQDNIVNGVTIGRVYCFVEETLRKMDISTGNMKTWCLNINDDVDTVGVFRNKTGIFDHGLSAKSVSVYRATCLTNVVWKSEAIGIANYIRSKNVPINSFLPAYLVPIPVSDIAEKLKTAGFEVRSLVDDDDSRADLTDILCIGRSFFRCAVSDDYVLGVYLVADNKSIVTGIPRGIDILTNGTNIDEQIYLCKRLFTDRVDKQVRRVFDKIGIIYDRVSYDFDKNYIIDRCLALPKYDDISKPDESSEKYSSSGFLSDIYLFEAAGAEADNYKSGMNAFRMIGDSVSNLTEFVFSYCTGIICLDLREYNGKIELFLRT